MPGVFCVPSAYIIAGYVQMERLFLHIKWEKYAEKQEVGPCVFLNKGLLPAKLVRLTSSVASLKTMAGVRKEEYVRGGDHPEQPHAPFQGGDLQHTARRQPHDGGIRAGGNGPGGAH